MIFKDTPLDFNRIIKNRASGYFLYNDKLANADYLDMSFSVGSGALYSTVQDLYLWYQALSGDKLVSKEYLDKIFSSYVDTNNFMHKKGYY